MRHARFREWAALALLVTALPATATSPVPVMIGASRDGALHALQKVVDRYLGPGRVSVGADYVGAHAGDPDPWMWTSVSGRGVEVSLVQKKLSSGAFGWYREGLGEPQLDGVNSGLLFGQGRPRWARQSVRLPASVTQFGFYVVREAGGHAIDGDDEPCTFFSNRKLNDVGPHGSGAVHAPTDGDVQMLIYDISRWSTPDTWLVACEFSDSGCRLGHGDGQSDNDFSDLVFTVSGVGVTPTKASSFGRLKAMFR